MHVFAAFGELSFSMLVSLLMLAVSALPVESSRSELTPETFGPSINYGLWFVEHYSPYCGHCKKFKSTWDQLVVEAEKELPTVRLSTINCILHGDLCNQNGIQGWPTMLMFEQGKIVGQFKGSRELDRLKNFIKQYVKEEPQTLTAPSSPSIKPPVINPTGEVLSLDSDLFTTTLLNGPAFIKFYAPWCGHCKKLAPIWKQLARHMKDKLTIAEVNCDDNASLCKSQSIEGYPTLIFFDGNRVKSEYNGGRKLEQLKAFSEKAASAGVHKLENPNDLESLVANEDVIYLLLHSPQDSEEILKFVTEAAAPLLGSPAIYASSSPELQSQFPIPFGSDWSITVHKDHDTHLPSSTFYGSYGVTQGAQLRTWLLTHRLPTTLELTQDTFQSVMNAPQAPLVVIAASQAKNNDKIKNQFHELAEKWRRRTEGSGMVNGREVVFTWMDMNDWGKWMKSMYGIESNNKEHDHDHDNAYEDLDDVKVIIADHSKLIYYETDRLGSPIKMSSSAKLFSAVDDAASGKSSYKHSENYAERAARYLSDKLKPIETFIYDKPYHALFILFVGLSFIMWGFFKLIGDDISSTNQSFQAYKGKNGRLD